MLCLQKPAERGNAAVTAQYDTNESGSCDAVEDKDWFYQALLPPQPKSRAERALCILMGFGIDETVCYPEQWSALEKQADEAAGRQIAAEEAMSQSIGSQREEKRILSRSLHHSKLTVLVTQLWRLPHMMTHNSSKSILRYQSINIPPCESQLENTKQQTPPPCPYSKLQMLIPHLVLCAK